jgi:hypothetical protein
VNAQAELFANGAVNICYGEGTIGNNYYGFVARIEGGGGSDLYWTEGCDAYYPLPGLYFNNESITTGQWPANRCYCFNLAEMNGFVESAGVV